MRAQHDRRGRLGAGWAAAPLLALAGYCLLAPPAFGQGNSIVLSLPKWNDLTIAGTQTKIYAPGDSAYSFASDYTYLRIGRLWANTDVTNQTGWSSSWPWPGGITVNGRTNTSENERYGSVAQKQYRYGLTKNWTHPTGLDSAALLSPTSTTAMFDQPYLTGGGGSAMEGCQIQRWVPPQAYVNGVQIQDQGASFGTTPGSPSNGDGEKNFGVVRGILDPALDAERVTFQGYRWGAGFEEWLAHHAYSGVDDQDYILYDFTFVNNGYMDRRGRMSGRDFNRNGPLNDFWYFYYFRIKNTQPSEWGPGCDGGGDDLLEYINPWPNYKDAAGKHHVLALFYDGNKAGMAENWGSPCGGTTTWGVDLWAKGYYMVGWLFSEQTPGSGIDDLRQPEATQWAKSNTGLTAGASGGQALYRRIVSNNNTNEVPYRKPENITQIQDGLQQPEPTPWQGIHFSQIPFGTGTAGNYARAIMLVAVGGLDNRTSRSLAWTQRARLAAAVSPVQTPAEIALIQSGRDSVKKTVDRAFWNVYGYDPNPPGGTPRWANKPTAQKRPFNVSDPPPPPSCLWANTGDGRIDLQWTPLTDNDKKDHDTGVNDFAGYRVYRSIGSPDSDRTLIYEGPLTAYQDRQVSKDFEYYYAVSAYDDGTQNWSNAGKKLESGQYWCWTGWYYMGVRPSGKIASTPAGLDSIRVVPNPYNIRLDFPQGARTDEVLWKNLPAPCMIRVYTAAGDLVHEIDHTIGGSEPWNLKTTNNQYIATGVYIYTIDSEIGSHVGKFVVIR